MNIHFIAIGGSVMHNIAIALHQKGHKITGSDDIIDNPSKSKLKKKGLFPKQLGWFPEKITQNLDAVIFGMNAQSNNSELIKAQKIGLKIYSYPEFLFEYSKNKTRVVIAGSHGKTTITSMVLHVLNYHEKKIDYVVSAQSDGFETMVHLTIENEFIVLEGEEYLSSPIDRTPKFHLYKPNIALISGISWDHINVFPCFENYIEQFKIFINSLTDGGILIYNQEDVNVKTIVENSERPIKKYPYKTPTHFIENHTTSIDTPNGNLLLEIFGNHNLQNLAGAKLICQHMSINEDDFYEAITTFKGVNKRLEKIAENNSTTIFKDFAYSPSKVRATTLAVKNQYKKRTLLACLELHTYSSLNASFLNQYKKTLYYADVAVVFFSPKNLKIKQLTEISKHQIKNAFQKKDLIIYTNLKEFKEFLFNQNLKNSVLLLMSSGNYGGLNFDQIKKLI